MLVLIVNLVAARADTPMAGVPEEFKPPSAPLHLRAAPLPDLATLGHPFCTLQQGAPNPADPDADPSPPIFWLTVRPDRTHHGSP